MDKYTPKNPADPDKVKIEKRRSVELLPAENQTKINSEFLASTLDHLIQPQQSKEVDGYIGDKPSYFNSKSDFYINEPNALREFYQLTTAMVQKNSITGEIEKSLFYDDLVNHLRFQGANVDNHERLFNQEYYSWQPPIDLDKFLNFRNYFWVPTGGLPVEVGVIRTSYDGDSLTETFATPDDLALDPNLLLVEVNGSSIPEFVDDVLNPQVSWFKIITPTTIKIHPTPTQGTTVRISLFSPNQSNIDDAVVDAVTSTLETYPGYTRALSTGMRFKIINDVNPLHNGKVYIAEGVGRGIWLVVDSIYENAWDTSAWDRNQYDLYENVRTPDYIVIERGSADANPWSKYNRWFHRDVIENFFDKTLTKVQAERPIIEFQKNLELYNYGNFAREPIQLVVDDIPGFLNIILSLTEANVDYVGRGFELQITNDNAKIWRHVKHDIEIWAGTASDYQSYTGLEIWPSKALGYSEVRVNGVQLYDGLRFLLINEPSSALTNRIYEITGIAADSAIIPILTVDGQEATGVAQDGESVWNTSNHLTYWFAGSSWTVAQNKTSVNQAPLFNLYDMFENKLGNTGSFPKNTFRGNKIFSYKENTNLASPKDTVLGMRLVYDEYGEILFENSIVTDRTFYTNADNNVIEIAGFYFHKTDDKFSNDWHKVPYVSPQKFTQRFVSDRGNSLFRMKMAPRTLPFSGDFTEVKINDKLIGKNQYFIQNNILRVLPDLVTHGSTVEITMIGDLVDENTHTFVTEQFTHTGGSTIFTLQVQPITPLTNDTIEVRINGEPVDILEITNESLEANQIRYTGTLDVGDVVAIGVMVPTQITNEFAFWNLPSNLVVNPGNEEITTIGRGNFIDHFTNSIRRQVGFEGIAEAVNNYRDTGKVKFLGDRILQHSAPMLKLMYMVADQRVDFIKSIRFVEREYTRFKNKFAQQLKLIQDQNELFDTDPVDEWVELALDRLNVGKTPDFAFYNSGVAGVLTWIPPTPSFLGAMPVYNPMMVWDNTTGVPTKYIQGHDGSKLLAYNDIRDDVFLALEQRIFDSIPAEITTEGKEAFDFKKFKPGKFRETEYSYNEYINILSPIFERWTANNSVNYRVNSTYDEFDPFTWNYSTCLDLLGDTLPGNWRGIYMYYFDTDRPHTHPWEMLGFTVKPDWWDQQYGVAPYTRGNTPLWDDINDGIIRFGVRQGQYEHLARSSSDISIWDILPVGNSGELLSPIDAGIVRTPPVATQASMAWNAGDFGPVETVWMQSEQWQFAQAQAAYLMKPTQFIESTWDVKNRFVAFPISGFFGEGISDDQILDLTTNSRSTLKQVLVHDETTSGPIRYGIQQFLTGSLQQNGLDIKTNLGDSLRNTYVQLGHKMAGFTTDRVKVMTDSYGVVPSEDIIAKLYESPSVREETYSGVIIEWTGNSYRVYGYDVLDPRFKVIPNNTNGRKVKIPIGSKQPTYEEWAPLNSYNVGDLVLRTNVFYRCIRSHKSRNVFDSEFWAVVNKPGTTAWIELVKKLDPVVGSPVVAVPYGTEYRSVQDVFDFLISYERYLESRGWVFDDFDNELGQQKDWTLSGKQFATWSINQWEPGTFIALSPVSKRLKFKSAHGLIKPVEQIINGVYSLLNRNGDRIETNKTVVSRFEDSMEIVPEQPNDNLQGIYAARIFVSEIEHALFFSNKTIFNDLIYDPASGLRQPRLRVSFVKTINWNGRLDAPGFLISGDKLISNFEKSANDFRKYFDIEEQVDDVGLKNYANHLLAYQPRPYLNQLIISDKSQLNFYQGMIQQKGTPGSLNKLLRSEFVTQDSDLQMLEEWAFRLGSYGAYDANPSMELRVPISDYDNDPQLVEIKEVMFDDAPTHLVLSWIDDYLARTSVSIPENRDEWSNDIWDDWFNTFFRDDPNDKTITAFIVRDNSGRILAGDSRWQLRPDTTARSYTDRVFPMIPNDVDSQVLPTAGYVHMEEYDHVFRNIEEMTAAGIYDLESGSIRRYADGDVVWLYDNRALERRTFTLDSNGDNVLDALQNDVFSGATSFKADWSIFRLLEQEFKIVGSTIVPNSSFLELETDKPHGLKKGEILVVYDISERTLFSNPSPMVIKYIVSSTKFRAPSTQFANVSFDSLVILKMTETRFNALTKEAPQDYALKNYLQVPGFDAETAAERNDKIWVDAGVELSNGNKTNGWMTYEFDWLANEDESQDIVYARVNPTFNFSNWHTQDGFDAKLFGVSRFVLGKATVTAYANGKYELVKDDNAPIGNTSYQLFHDAVESKLAVSLRREARYFKDAVPYFDRVALFGACKSFSEIRYEKLVSFEGRFVVSTLSAIATAPLSTNEFMFDGSNMYYWDGSSLSIVTLFEGDRWIRGDQAVIYTGANFVSTPVVGSQFWFNTSLGLLFKHSAVTNKFSKVTPTAGSIWADSTSSAVYGFIDNKFKSVALPVNDYFYDEVNRKMFTSGSAGLTAYELGEDDVWCNGGVLYDSCSCANLEPIQFTNGDLFYDTDDSQLKRFDGTTFVSVDTSQVLPGFKQSINDGKLYYWDSNVFFNPLPGLFYNEGLYEWDGEQLTSVTVDHLTFAITEFRNVILYNGSVLVGSDSIFDLTDTVEFPEIEQVDLLEINWKRLGPLLKEKRRQQPKVDSHSIHNSLLYDGRHQQIDAFLYAYDPIKGIIPGNAAREIWFRLSQDPAVYSGQTSTGETVASTPDVWGRTNLGMLWWDLSTVRYVDYEMDSLEYKRNYWGKHAPLSQVDVYEWVRSLETPEVYARTADANRNQDEHGTKPAGEPFKLNGVYRYNVISEFDDASKSIKTFYYFWVRNKRTLPTTNRVKYGRKLTAAQISAILTNPTQHGVVWANPIAENALVFANVSGYISGNDSILQVNWKSNHNDGNTHRHYVLGREGDENWIPEDALWNKMHDSLLGYVYYPKTTFVKGVQGNTIELDESLGLRSFGLITIGGVSYPYKHGNGRFVTLVSDIIPTVNSTVVYESLLVVPDEVLTDSQRYGTQFRPRQSWFKDPNLARKNLVENFNYQMKQVWLDSTRFAWDANMYQAEPTPDVTEFDRQVPDILTRDVLVQNSSLPKGYRVLVDGNAQTENLWTLWLLEDNNQARPVWNLITAQRYRMTDFWEKADFYDITVDSADIPQRVFRNIVDFENKVNSGMEFADGEIIQILNVLDMPNSAWEWRKYSQASQTWQVVAREKGTIRLKDSLHKNDLKIITEDHFYRQANPSGRSDYTPFWDLTPYDSSPWDASGGVASEGGLNFSNLDAFVQHMRSRDGSIELGLLLNEVRSNQNFFEYIEQNKLFFSMVNFVHAEQLVVDWAFKTSYIVITGYTEALRQSEIIYPDIIGPLFDYINEVKPYHVKIRDFSRRVGYLDTAKVCATDFDKPVYQDIDGNFRVLDPSNTLDMDIICEEVDDCYDNIYKPYGDASGTCEGESKYSSLVRNMTIEQRFDRVSCDTTSNTFSPVWDMVPWDIYSWDPQAMGDGSANEPFLFRIVADGRSVVWDISETDTNRFYNVITKSNNKTENLSYFPVPGYSVDRKWMDAIDRVVIKDIVAGTETILPKAQWAITDVSTDVTLRLRLVLRVAPKANTVVEIVRTLTELDRILRMYKVIQTTKTGAQVEDILSTVPLISGCDFDGTVVDGANFGSGWDQADWDFGTGTIQLPPRPAFSEANRYFGPVFVDPQNDEAIKFIPGNPPFDQLVQLEGSTWKPVVAIVGDTIVIGETGLIKIWNGVEWMNSQAVNKDGWDESIDVAKDSDINNSAPSEWEFIVSDGSDTFVLQDENTDFGTLAYLVVYLDNSFVNRTEYNDSVLFDNQLVMFNGDVVVFNGSGTYDFTWDGQRTLVFNSSIPTGTHIKVYKVYDYNGSGDVNSTFLSPTANPTQDPWETLIEGGNFVQPWFESGRPEELAYLNMQDPLILDIYNRPAPGAPIVAKNKFKGNGSVGPFSLHQIAQSKEAIQVFANGLLVDDDEYEIDWAEQTITFVDPTTSGTQYLIASHSSGGDAVWETFFNVSTGIPTSYDLTGIPLIHGLMVTVNGEELAPSEYTVEGPQIEAVEYGTPLAVADYEISLVTTPSAGDTVTVSVFANIMNNLMFSVDGIAVANTDEFIAQTDLNQTMNLGPYGTTVGTATEFELTNISNPDFPAWDKVVVYHNGERLCGPDAIYHTANGVDNCFDVKPITIPINKDLYAVYQNEEMIDKQFWNMPTKMDGLVNAKLSAGYDSLSNAEWSYLNGAWTGQQIQLEIFDADTSVSGAVTIFDVTGDGVISQIDVIQSIWITLNTLAKWQDVRVGLRIYTQDGAIHVETNNSMSVRISELTDAPIVGAFFGTANPTIFSDVAADEYLFGGALEALSDNSLMTAVINQPPGWTVEDNNVVFDFASSTTADSKIKVDVTVGTTTTTHMVDIFDGINDQLLFNGEPLLFNGEVVALGSDNDGQIDMSDLYLSLKAFFEAEYPAISVTRTSGSWDSQPYDGVTAWDLAETFVVCTPPNCSVSLSDTGNNPIVSAGFGVEDPILVGETLVNPLIVASSVWMLLRVNNNYIGINVVDLDSDGFIEAQDVVSAINSSPHLLPFGVSAVLSNFAITISMTGFGYLQVLNGDLQDVVGTFFGAKRFTTGTTITTIPGNTSSCEVTPLELIVNFNHTPYTVTMKDLNLNGLLTAGVLASNINGHTALKNLGITASVVEGKVRLSGSKHGYLEVKDSNEDYQLATHFFGGWQTSTGAVALTAAKNEICLSWPVIDNTTFEGWSLEEMTPANGDEIIIGVFENHGFEINDNILRVLPTLSAYDEITAITFNSNDSMKIRTDKFLGNADGAYVLSLKPATDEYLWVAMNGKRLINKQHYIVEESTASWDVDGWDPIDDAPTYRVSTATRNIYAGDTFYGLSPIGFDTEREFNSIQLMSGQTIADELCVTIFSGEPRTAPVAWRMFRTHSGQWEQIRVSDANKTELKSDLLQNATFMDVWESNDIPEFMREMSPLMTPNSTYRLPGSVWIDGERINYWELQGPFTENGRRWWRLGPIVRSTFKTSFGVEDVIETVLYRANGTQTAFDLPDSYNAGDKVIVERISSDLAYQAWDAIDVFDTGTTGWDLNEWDQTTQPSTGIRLIERNADLEQAVTDGTFISNSGYWDWDYEIVGDQVVFKTTPTSSPVVLFPNIRLSVFEREYTSSNVTHKAGALVIDGNINQRIPGGYTWKWHNTVNNGMQRNKDEMSKFLLSRPGTLD